VFDSALIQLFFVEENGLAVEGFQSLLQNPFLAILEQLNLGLQIKILGKLIFCFVNFGSINFKS
jgi:hypothetical protein